MLSMKRPARFIEDTELICQYGKTIPQFALRWFQQRGAIIIPKSSRKERINEKNQDFFVTLSH